MELSKHIVLLATGVRAPLLTVSGTLFVLDRWLASTPENRKLAGQLRMACLTDDPMPPEATAAFVDYGLATENGSIDPAVRNVVLAAVRGEHADLHVVSPFVYGLDRALSDLINSREKVRGHFPPEVAEPLIAEKIVSDEIPSTESPKSGKSWLHYVMKKPPGPGFTPPLN